MPMRAAPTTILTHPFARVVHSACCTPHKSIVTYQSQPQIQPRTARGSPCAMASRSDLPAAEGVVPEGERAEVEAATRGFVFQQTMYRIKDPKKSLDFYTRILGFRLLERLDFPDAKFSLYFLGYHAKEDIPENKAERVEWMFKQPATLELTHNHGSEDDPDWKAHSGNEEPKGYGHIGFHVPDVEAACDRFEKLGVQFQKRPQDGSMKGLAFIRDPDGYWIEILNAAYSAKSFG